MNKFFRGPLPGRAADRVRRSFPPDSVLPELRYDYYITGLPPGGRVTILTRTFVSKYDLTIKDASVTISRKSHFKSVVRRQSCF